MFIPLDFQRYVTVNLSSFFYFQIQEENSERNNNETSKITDKSENTPLNPKEDTKNAKTSIPVTTKNTTTIKPTIKTFSKLSSFVSSSEQDNHFKNATVKLINLGTFID